MDKIEYRTEYSFTEDEIKALKELNETLIFSAGQEVISDILENASINGYRGDKGINRPRLNKRYE